MSIQLAFILFALSFSILVVPVVSIYRSERGGMPAEKWICSAVMIGLLTLMGSAGWCLIESAKVIIKWGFK